MAVNSRWRFNPFTGANNALLITAEPHTIEFFTEQNAYGFFANEGVKLDTGAPVVLTQDNSALTAFTEMPKTVSPNAGQFRVDYDSSGYYNTGFVNCNAADVGKAVLFTYYGTGTIVHPTFRPLTEFNFPGSVTVEATLSAPANFVAAGDVDIKQAGAVFMYAGSSTPTGYLPCDGAAVSRTTYARLFTAIGTTYGVGNGTTTFNVPDLRGMFVRATGTHGTNLKADGNAFAGGALGDYVADITLEHKHGVSDPTHAHGIPGASKGPNLAAGSDSKYYNGPPTTTNAAATGLTVTGMTAGSGVSLRSGTETKPASISLNFIIKT